MSNLQAENLNERVKVNIGITKNLGDFNSLRVDLGAERDLRPGETLAQGFRDLVHEVDRNIDKAVAFMLEDD